MKNYSLKLEDYKTFVLNYTIKDDLIIVNLVTGENYIIPYTEENEKKLLERMKNQVLNSDKCVEKQKKRFIKSLIWVIIDIIVVAYNILTIGHVLPILSGLFAGFFTFATISDISSMIASKKYIKDINKNRMLLDNEEKINEKVRENPNVLANTDEKVKEMVASTPIEQPVFTLNNIDNIEYEQLKQILENIDREEEFGFDYPSVSEDKPMVLNKKLK